MNTKSGFPTGAFDQETWTMIMAGLQRRSQHLNRKGSAELCWESIFIADGAVARAGAVREELAALETARQAAEAASRAKSAFLAAMSHEIRTPLNAILGFAQLMQRDTSLTPAQQQRVQTIHRSGEHLLALINDILDISRIEAGGATLAVAAFDLQALIHDLETMFRVRTDARQLQFTVTPAPGLPRILHGDEHKLRQIFINLLGNAVKFTAAGGIDWRVRIDRQPGGEPRLISEVIDTGPGISAADLPRVFAAYEQACAGRLAGEGTGLGLSISRKLAQLLGGDISVASQVGQGSTFRLDIPIQSAPSDSLPPATGRTSRRVAWRGLQPGQAPCRVLIADDDAANRTVMAEMLQAAGFETQQVGDGEQAVACCATWRPHIVLLDMHMPVLDGLQAMRSIRALAADAPPTIIAVTASAFENERRQILAAGVDGYLRKPFTTEELFEALQCCAAVSLVFEPEQPAPCPRSADDLQALPCDLVRQMQQETITANIDHLTQLIDQATVISPAVAHRLGELAAGYEYETLSALFTQRIASA